MTPEATHIINQAPDSPGVYSMIDANGLTIYIGKAKNLKNRLKSYTQKNLQIRTACMVKMIDTISYTLTNSEVEALMLEANLIKQHKPKFNILLKDDKAMPYLKLIDSNTGFAQLTKCRVVKPSNELLFGPFASVQYLNQTLRTIQKIFKVRTCTDQYFKARKRPCLLYQIGSCSGPCVGRISSEEYNQSIKELVAYFKGKATYVLQDLKIKMQEYSDNMDYEKAIMMRDKIRALHNAVIDNGVMNKSLNDADVVGIMSLQELVCIKVFTYKAGQNLGHKTYIEENIGEREDLDLLSSFLMRYYDNRPHPKLILTNIKFDPELPICLANIGVRSEIKYNARLYADVINLVNSNLQSALNQYIKTTTTNAANLELLKEAFSLDAPPQRVEVYDNSHIMGASAVGVMIVANKSGFDKSSYRKFNIKSQTYGDDYAMLREVLTRRFAKTTSDMPDFMIIDGGKGHMSVVQDVMKMYNISIPFVCMAKGPERKGGEEVFFTTQNKDGFKLKAQTSIYVQALRNEAHSFAIKSHRHKRSIDMGYNV